MKKIFVSKISTIKALLKTKNKYVIYVLTNTFFMNLKKIFSLNFLGKLFFSSIFVNAIPGKITNFSGQLEFISSRGFPEPFSIFLLISSTILLICGVILLIFSDKTKLACSLLLIFLIPTTLIFHLVPLQIMALSRNLSLIGGLFIAIDRAMVSSVNDNFVRVSKELEYSDLNEDN